MQKILTSEEVIKIHNLAFRTGNIHQNKQNNPGTLTNMISLSAVQYVLFTLQPKCEIETICGTHYSTFSSTDRLIAYALHYILQYNRVTCNYESQLMSHSHQCPVSDLQLTILHSCPYPVFYLLITWSSSARLSIKFATTKYCWNQIICNFTYNRSFKSSLQSIQGNISVTNTETCSGIIRVTSWTITTVRKIKVPVSHLKSV